MRPLSLQSYQLDCFYWNKIILIQWLQLLIQESRHEVFIIEDCQPFYQETCQPVLLVWGRRTIWPSLYMDVSKTFKLSTIKSTVDSNRNNCAKLFIFLIVCSKMEGKNLVIFGFMNSYYFSNSYGSLSSLYESIEHTYLLQSVHHFSIAMKTSSFW